MCDISGFGFPDDVAFTKHLIGASASLACRAPVSSRNLRVANTSYDSASARKKKLCSKPRKTPQARHTNDLQTTDQ